MPDMQTSNATVMHSFTQNKRSSSPAKPLFILLIAVCLGIGAGYGIARYSAKTGTSVLPLPDVNKGKVYGSNDTSIFKDSAEGVLQPGGSAGEGQYHLVRPGGESQNVYVTSSTLDLSQFIGKKVKVWGQTQASQKVGWLMDVGRVEIE